MSSCIPPDRYGYQSVRAGSQKWMCASTMRAIGSAISPQSSSSATSWVAIRRSTGSTQSGISGPP